MATDYLGKCDLKGRVAVVTGGERGIGLACAEARLVLLERDEAAAASGAETLAALGAEVSTRIINVTDQNAVEAAAIGIERDVGAVDILICCAGIAISGVAAETAAPEL